jgi:hypothetical protein
LTVWAAGRAVAVAAPITAAAAMPAMAIARASTGR